MSNKNDIEKRPGGTGWKNQKASVDKPSYTIRPNNVPPPKKKE